MEHETPLNHETPPAAKPLLAAVGSVVNQGKKSYIVSDEKIENGDLVWNEPSKSIDKCVAVIGDNIVVQFSSGMRAVFWKERFQKLVAQ